MSVPDAIAPLIGYRSWGIWLGELWSVHAPDTVRWPRTKPLRAVCLRNGVRSFFNPRIPEHAAPHSSCTCGTNAVFAPWDVECGEPLHHWNLVSGRVEGWGRVALGEKGFRAELARPLELFAEPSWEENTWCAAARVAGAYGIPLVSLETSLTEQAPRQMLSA